MEPIAITFTEQYDSPLLRCPCGAVLARRHRLAEGHQTLHPVSLVKVSFQLTTPYGVRGECRHCSRCYAFSLPRG